MISALQQLGLTTPFNPAALPAQQNSGAPFLPCELEVDRLRAAWIGKGLIDRNGLLTAQVDRNLPLLAQNDQAGIREKVGEKKIDIESTLDRLYWKTSCVLHKLASFFMRAPKMHSCALTGYYMYHLLSDTIREHLTKLGFEGVRHFDHFGELTLLCSMQGVPQKKEVKDTLNGFENHLKLAVPAQLINNQTIAILQETFHKNYQFHQISDGIVGNTGFRTHFYKEEGAKRYLKVAVGDEISQPTGIVITYDMPPHGVFCFEDLRLDITPLFGEGSLTLSSDQGGLQAMVDFVLKRVRLKKDAVCDPLTFFYLHALKANGYLIEDPEEAEKTIFEKAKELKEKDVALIIAKMATLSPYGRNFSALLIMVSSLASAARLGAKWDFSAIVREITPLIKKDSNPSAQIIYDAIFLYKFPFPAIEAVLHIFAYLHYFTKPEPGAPISACLTESSRKTALQLQFGGHTALFPFDIKASLNHILQTPSLVPIMEGLLPLANLEKKEVPATLLPNFFEMALSLKDIPYLALQFFLLDGFFGANFAPKPVMDLLFTLLLSLDEGKKKREIAGCENYLVSRRIYPRWNLLEVKSEEDAICALAGSGVNEFCQYAFTKWRVKEDAALGVKILKAILHTNQTLALRIKDILKSKAAYTKEMQVEVKALTMVAVLENDIEMALRQKDMKRALNLVLQLAKTNSGNLESLLDRIINRPQEVRILLREGHYDLALHYWQMRFVLNLDLCEAIFLALPSNKKEKMDLGCLLLKEGRPVSRAVITLLQEDHPKRYALFLALLTSSCEIKNGASVKTILYQVSMNHMNQVEDVVRLWEAAKLRQFKVIDFIRAVNFTIPFLRAAIQKGLLTPTEALEALLIFMRRNKMDDVFDLAVEVLEKLAGVEEVPFPEELIPLLQRDKRLAYLMLALDTDLPNTLVPPLVSLCEEIDIKEAVELYELAKSKGLKLNCPKILRYEAAEGLETKDRAALGKILELMELPLLQKAFDKGVLNALQPHQAADILELAFKEEGSMPMKEALILQLNAGILKKKGHLKQHIQSFCPQVIADHLEGSRWEEARNLLAASKQLEISPALIKGPLLKPLADKFPEVKGMVVPFLEGEDAFLCKSAKERGKILLKGAANAPLAVHALDAAAELIKEKSFKEAIDLFLKFHLKAPLWKDLLSAMTEAKDPLIAYLLLRKREMEELCPRKILERAIEGLFAACPDAQAILNVRSQWDPFLMTLPPLNRAAVDFIHYFCLINQHVVSVVDQANQLQRFYCLPEECFAPLSQFFSSATQVFLLYCSLCKDTVFARIKPIVSEIFGKLLERGDIVVDNILALSVLAKNNEEGLALKVILKGLEHQNFYESAEAKKQSEAVVRKLLLAGCVMELFPLFDHPNALQLLGANYQALYFEGILSALHAVAEHKQFQLLTTLDLFKRLNANLAFTIPNQALNKRAQSKFILAVATCIIYSDEMRLELAKAWPKMDLEFQVKFAIQALRIAQGEEGVNFGALKIIATLLKPNIAEFTLNDQKSGEEAVYLFCTYCLRTKDSDWIREASELFAKGYIKDEELKDKLAILK
jgi:hypothetical protein